MSVLDKIKKNSTIKESAILAKSKFFCERDNISTKVPALNIAFSARPDGGFSSGTTMWAGVSKMFKTGFSLLMGKAYLDKYPDAAILFYDSEFGSPQSYFDTFGIPLDKVLHTPITDVEELKFDIMKQLKELDRNDKVIIIIDSIGNLASKKEVEDALEQKSAADMTRAKQIKSLFRMVTPHLIIKDIPMIVVNHTYKEMSLYPKDIVGGGTGSYYAADNIYILTRSQEKDGGELSGWNFTINVEKSRYVKEKSKIPINIGFDSGISKYSGLMDIALELGYCIKPSNGWYAKVDRETGEIEEKKYRLKDTNNMEFWNSILNSKGFNNDVYKYYSISSSDIFNDNIDNGIVIEEDKQIYETIGE